MPVSVQSVPTVHSDIRKRTKSGDSTNAPSPAVSRLLKRTLPLSPSSPLPSFGSHQQWISPLPSWRGTRTNHTRENFFNPTPIDTFQSFLRGLAGAVDAPAIKGAHVQTCIPPLSVLLPKGVAEMPSCSPRPCDLSTSLQQPQDTPLSNTSCHSPVSPELIGGDVPDMQDDSPDLMGRDGSSSPIEPVTPFGDYVDRAVAASDAIILHDPLVPSRSQELRLPASVGCGIQCHLHAYAEAKKAELVFTVNEPANASLIHKHLAEPMAEWLVSYIWKVCTNTLVLPQMIAPYTLPNAPQLRQSVPLYLAPRVYSLLMSTLLQPSAMLLALWYIVQLPIYFGAPGLGPEHVKERRFRVEMLSDTHDVVGGESPEGTVTFRLIVLGCMLANKWLDDHTFSNKTWHTISNVPVHLLNKLEYFALDILSYDLSISLPVWSQWLGHLLSYHHSLTTTTYPQPIARPLSNTNGLVRRTIQEIMEARLGRSMKEPVFLDAEKRLKNKLGFSALAYEPEAFDIDLDEDGPLREEYLPRRRASNESSSGGHIAGLRGDIRTGPAVHHGFMSCLQDDISLPPPAKWSPAGDEPIHRSSGTGSVYLPVQPSVAPNYGAAIPAVYHRWPSVRLPYTPFRHHPEGDYTTNTLPILQHPYWVPVSSASAVQHPHPFSTPEYYVVPNHFGGYSLGGFDYRCGGDTLFCETTGCPQATVTWTPLHQYGYRRSLGPHPPPLGHRSTWMGA